MQLLITMILCIGLVIALIRWLHIRQLRQTRENADQSMPLAPLAESAPLLDQDRDNTVQVTDTITAQTGTSTSWRDEVKQLRDSGNFQEALTLCRRQYPRMLAFRQTMITLRSRLKTDDVQPEDALKQIYRTAILAGLVKSSQDHGMSADDIMATLPDMDDPQAYWNQIGYKHLDLLGKTDRHLLINHWGEPGNHKPISILLNQVAAHHPPPSSQ